MIAPRLVFEVGDDIVALSWTELVEPVCGLQPLLSATAKWEEMNRTFFSSDSFLLAMKTLAPFCTKP